MTHSVTHSLILFWTVFFLFSRSAKTTSIVFSQSDGDVTSLLHTLLILLVSNVVHTFVSSAALLLWEMRLRPVLSSWGQLRTQSCGCWNRPNLIKPKHFKTPSLMFSGIKPENTLTSSTQAFDARSKIVRRIITVWQSYAHPGLTQVSGFSLRTADALIWFQTRSEPRRD